MDERCKSAHEKLLSGNCPWCGQYIIGGQVENTALFKVLAQGQTLQQLIEIEGVCSFSSAIEILKQIAEHLSSHHKSRGIIGALSPSLIVVSEAGVFIYDNAYTQLDDLSSVSDSGIHEKLKIVDYLAPEKALASHQADSRADIYSLGCILYFLLTGHPPFPDGSISERLLKHQIEKPPSLLRERPNVPSKLIKIYEKMVAKSPQYRYQSADELLADLRTLNA